MVRHLTNDARKFTKCINQLKKIPQTLPPVLRQEYETEQAVLSFVMRTIFWNFLDSQKSDHLSENPQNDHYSLICEQLKKFSNGNPGLFNLTPGPEESQSELGKPHPAMLARREIDLLCDGLFKIKGRNILGDIYEALLDNNRKKGSGQYYTPDFIVDYILDQTLGEADVVRDSHLSVLDPACGCGHFLLRAYDFLKEKFRQALPRLRDLCGHLEYRVCAHSGENIVVKGDAYWQEENLHYHILRHCLFGADIDGGAAALTLAALAAKGRFSFSPVINVICCDSLVRPENPSQPHFTFWSKKYNYVVGNPPYVSFGLKRAGKLKTETAQYLRLNYPHSAEYKISYYALFLERFIELAAPGGRIGVITPDSFLIGRYFSKIRRFILDNCLINEILLLNQPVFAATVGFPVVSIFTKINDSTALSKPHRPLTAKKWFGSDPPVVFQYPQNYFEKQPYFRFRLFFNQTDKDIVDKMDNSPYVLSDFTKIKTGMRSLTTQKDIIITPGQPLSGMCKKAIISSAQVKPFFIDYQGEFLDADPAKLNPGGWDKAVIENPKIFIRQTGSFLIAAIDEDKLYHLNNVHSISLSGGGSLEYFLCLINSALMNYYYRTVSLETGRPMAQTDIETLEKLPVVLSPKHVKTLTTIAQKLQKSMKIYTTLKNKSGLREKLLLSSISRLKTRLNNIIYRLYGLNAAEIRHVEGKY